jgi:membrane protein DedA with SNARE-associated domain
MDGLSGWSNELVGQYGFWGMALGLALNCVGVPFPSEVSLPLAGLAVQQGHWQLAPVFLIMTIAQELGLVVTYALVRWHGTRKRGWLHGARMKRLQKRLKKRDAHVVFTTIMLPGVHGFAGYAAGLAKMPFWRFLGVSTLAMAVWTGSLMALGYFASSQLGTIYSWFQGAGVVLLVVALGVVLIWYSRHHRA